MVCRVTAIVSLFSASALCQAIWIMVAITPAVDADDSAVDLGTAARFESQQIADMDRDGRLDIVAAGWTTKNLVIFWNRTAG